VTAIVPPVPEPEVVNEAAALLVPVDALIDVAVILANVGDADVATD
jgi:hypothetical protein